MFDLPELEPSPALQALGRILAEPGVTDLVCNGHLALQVLRGGVWIGVSSPFGTPEELEALARQLARAAGKRLDLSLPFANFSIGAKLRVHLVLASAVSQKTQMSFRVLAQRHFGLGALVQIGAIDEATRSRLSGLMRSGASVLISGASGSGKTTLLRALLDEVSDQRVVAIEDVSELLLETDSFVGLLARAANTEGRGAIELDQLLVESLRMRPDRIVVGEVRSKELVTLLQAANSGHAVAATIHANAADRVLERMASIGLASSISATAVRQLSSAIDAFIHIDVHDAKRTLTIREAI